MNVIGPSPVPTDLMRPVPADKLAALLGKLPLPRMGTVEDVINVLEFFLRPESAAITGQVVYLGGVSD